MALAVASAVAIGQTVATPPQLPPPGGTAYIAVDYPDTTQGHLARFTIRRCAEVEEPGLRSFLRETPTSSSGDVVVRLVGADGGEVSRTVGNAAVCQYARFAAAYLARL